MSKVKYDAKIHRRAKRIIKEKEGRIKYESDCLKAKICAKCGGRLIDKEGDFNLKNDCTDLLTLCEDCGFVAEIN